MKQVTYRPGSPYRAPRRLSVSEAKAKLSEALRDVREAPTVIHSRGHDIAVLMGIEDYQRLAADPGTLSGASFVQAVEELKRRLGGGAELKTEPARLQPFEPFASPRKRRKKR